MAEPNHRRRLVREVVKREARRQRGRQGRRRPVWFWLGMFGLVGWSVAVPTVLATALGVWLDRRYPGGVSWTLTLLFVGAALGSWNAWQWVKREGGESGRDGDD